MGQGFEAAPIGGVGRVGHQFAQKNLPFRVERMNHQIEQAANFGAKFVGFYGRGVGHAVGSPV